MRESLQKLLEGWYKKIYIYIDVEVLSLSDTMYLSLLALHSPAGVSSVLQGLDSSSWLRHVHLVLEAGTFIAKVLTNDRQRCTYYYYYYYYW